MENQASPCEKLFFKAVWLKRILHNRLLGCVCTSAGPRRCLALSPLQAAAAGPDKAQLVDAAGCAYPASQEVQTGILDDLAL